MAKTNFDTAPLIYPNRKNYRTAIYLNVLNDTIRLPHESPDIGIIICKSKSRTIVEYALKTSTMPIGVATYSLSQELPEAYKQLLPTSDEIAQKLETLIKD